MRTLIKKNLDELSGVMRVIPESEQIDYWGMLKMDCFWRCVAWICGKDNTEEGAASLADSSVSHNSNFAISIVFITVFVLNLLQNNDVSAQAYVSKIYFGNVDENPLFNGKPAEEEFHKYIYKNAVYPGKAAANCVIGRVFVEFIVERNGSLSNLKIVGGADPVLEAEALRVVINSSPNWTPGKIDGETVRMSYTIPINFRIGANVKSSSKKVKLSKKTILLEEVDIFTFCAPCGENQCKLQRREKRRAK